MIATAPLRTPGLYFEALAPDPGDVLPRLDIAAFVGFAASGPLDVPVPVEDPASFENIFGGDLTIGAAGQLRAQLAPAVRAFFRNGGRRCWVVRVARGPVANLFVLPGIVGVWRKESSLSWMPATARARSEGSWSDSVAVNTTLTVTPLPLGAVDCREKPQSFLVTLDTGRSAIRAGELLRIGVGAPGLSAFVAIPPDPIVDEKGRVELAWKSAVWVEEADAEPWPFDSAQIAAAAWHVLPGGVREPVSILERARNEGTLRLTVAKAGGRPLREGSWIDLDVSTALPAGGSWLLQIERTYPTAASGSPPPDGAMLTFECGRAWRFATAPIASASLSAIQADALTFELWTRDGKARSVRLADLGFADGHARWWADLPTDADLFFSPELALGDQRTLARDVLQPRFPLAGPARDAPAAIFLPLGVPAAPRRELEEGAAPPLAHDGLDRIAADLFLDPALLDATVENLMEHAFRLRCADDGGSGRPLRGIHALTYLEEISLIAAPDALLVGAPDAQASPAPPGVTLVATTTGTDVRLEWPVVPDEAVAYTLQQSETSDFAMPSLSERLVPGASAVLLTNAGVNERRLDRLGGTCAPTRWYRVRVEGPGGGGPWSNTVRIWPAATSFEQCSQVGADAPELTATPSVDDLTLSWTDSGAPGYRLEASVEPTFTAAQLLVDGTATTFSMRPPLGVRYFRVRGQTVPAGGWSNSVRVDPDAVATSPAAGGRVTIDPACAVDVNAGLLTFCAARGDAFAVLGAPGAGGGGTPFDERDLFSHKTELVSRFLARDDRNTLSFGALYHPWLVVTQESVAPAEPRTVAPPGTICGLIAARTLAHGAWFAPANRPLAGVVSTTQTVDRTAWAALDAARINAVVLQPHGFVTLGAHTLSPDNDLREVSVRRLLILLRRLALREGPSLVFEPHGPDLRRSVRRQFERVLGDLFVRGALAGRTQREAFQVVVDETNNPPQSVDLGRLVVELRVAPSRPLAFLIVRFQLRVGSTATVESA
jgi:hypothetical protein